MSILWFLILGFIVPKNSNEHKRWEVKISFEQIL